MQIKHWFAKVRGWHPRQVDELSLEEMFWLPLQEEASLMAADQLREDK